MKHYLIVFVCIVLADGRSTPDYFPQCKRVDPNIDKCIFDGIEAMRPKLKQGIPEVNLPPLDPFVMKILNVNTSVTGATLIASITNIVAYGGSDFKINNLKLDLDNKYVGEFELLLPHIEVSADYNTRGSKLLFFNIDGVGKFNGVFNDVTVVANCTASPIIKDGVEYLQVDSLTTKVSIGKGDLDVHPKEDSFTGRATTSFIRSSPSFILNIISPAVDETAASVVRQYLSDVLSVIPLRDVLID